MVSEKILRISVDGGERVKIGRYTTKGAYVIGSSDEFDVVSLEDAPPKGHRPFCFDEVVDGLCFGVLIDPEKSTTLEVCCIECTHLYHKPVV